MKKNGTTVRPSLMAMATPSKIGDEKMSANDDSTNVENALQQNVVGQRYCGRLARKNRLFGGVVQVQPMACDIGQCHR